MLKRIVLFWLLASPCLSTAQEALFASIDPPSPDVMPPPTGLAVYASTINHDGLKTNPQTITISIPRPAGALNVTVQREQFIRRLGFSPAASFAPIAILRLATTSPGRGRESHGRGCSPTRVTIYPPVKPAFGQGKRDLLEDNLFMAN